MASIGTCRICGTGPLRWVKCCVCRRESVLCDECDSAWKTEDTSAKPVYASEESMPCPWCRASLVGSGSAWVL